MRGFWIGLVGVFALFSTPSLAAAPAFGRSAVPPAIEKPIEPVRMVTRCRVVRVWRYDRYHRRHLVPVRRCHRVHVR